MPHSYPSTALTNQLWEIERLADDELVYITENGHAKYVFMAQEVFEHAIADAVEQALYEERLKSALTQSRRDFAQGNYCSSREELKERVARKRMQNAQA